MDTSGKKYDFVYNFIAVGKNITEVINVKERGNQLFKDKFVLVMLVLGLLTIVAAAGAVRIQKGRENIGESPYLEIEDPDHVIAGDSNAGAESGGDTLAGELAASGDEAGNGEGGIGNWKSRPEGFHSHAPYCSTWTAPCWTARRTCWPPPIACSMRTDRRR